MNSNVILSTYQGARHSLRAETRLDHDAVDTVFSRFDLTSPAGYRQFLRAQGRCVGAVEQALEARTSHLVRDWSQRRRAGLLAADLRDMDDAVSDEVVAPDFDSDAAALGGVYVLEGSRLGGALLARRLYEGAPRRFLGTSQGNASWRSFVDLLERNLHREAERAAAIRAARSVFKCFEAAGRKELERPLGA